MVHMKTKCPKLGYGDEDVKKTVAIKQFVVKTLVEKVETTRTMMRILEVKTKKFDKNLSEKKTSDMIRKFSGEGFKSDENVDKMIDRFGDMITEMKKIKLAGNLDYAMGLSSWKGWRKVVKQRKRY